MTDDSTRNRDSATGPISGGLFSRTSGEKGVQVPGQQTASHFQEPSAPPAVLGQGSPTEAPGEGQGASGRKSARKRAGGGDEPSQTTSLFAEPAVDAGPDYGFRRIRLHRGEELNPYAQQRDAQTGMSSGLKKCIALGVVLAVCLLGAIVMPSGWFSPNMRGAGTSVWLSQLEQNMSGLVSMITLQGSQYSMEFKVSLYLIVALAGAALGISGAVYQGSLKNALASPSTLGVMAGCNLGRVVYVLFFMNASLYSTTIYVSEISDTLAQLSAGEYAMAVYGMSLCALAGGVVVVSCVMLISTVAGGGRVSSVVMVIAGQVFAAVISAVMQLVRYYFTETGDSRADLISNMQVSTLSSLYKPLDVVLIGLPLAVCIIIVLSQRHKVNLLAFSDDEARSMGLSTQRTRWLLVLTCTALTAIVVSFCGAIGMVGFMVPHIVRKVIGPDAKHLVPASALTGAAFLVIVYFATTLFGEGAASTFGVFTSLIGCVAFLVVALSQRGSSRGDWL